MPGRPKKQRGRKAPTASKRHRASLSASGGRIMSASSSHPSFALPTELLYDIVATVLGDFHADIIETPACFPGIEWDAIITLLHTSRVIRACTIKLLHYLWGETFIRGNGRIITNYKPTFVTFCRYAFASAITPELLLSNGLQVAQERLIRSPMCPFIHISKHLLFNSALEKLCWRYASLQYITAAIFTEGHVSRLNETAMSTVPANVQDLLLGRIWRQVKRRTLIWLRIRLFKTIMDQLHDVFDVLFRPGMFTHVRHPDLVDVRSRADDLTSFKENQAEIVLLDEKITLLVKSLQNYGATQRDSLLAILDMDPEDEPMIEDYELRMAGFYRFLDLLRFESEDQQRERMRNLGLRCLVSFLSAKELERYMGWRANDIIPL